MILRNSDLNTAEHNPLITTGRFKSFINIPYFTVSCCQSKKKEIPAAKLIVYHCYPDFIHCKDPGAGRGRYKPRKPKGTGINMCSKTNLQEVLIGPLVSLVHLCIKCIFTATVFSSPMGCVPFGYCLPLPTAVYSTQKSIKIHRSEVATPACRTCSVYQSMYEKMNSILLSPLEPSICYMQWLQKRKLLAISDETCKNSIQLHT